MHFERGTAASSASSISGGFGSHGGTTGPLQVRESQLESPSSELSEGGDQDRAISAGVSTPTEIAARL